MQKKSLWNIADKTLPEKRNKTQSNYNSSFPSKHFLCVKLEDLDKKRKNIFIRPGRSSKREIKFMCFSGY